MPQSKGGIVSQQFKHLFSPIKIGAITIKNRIACSPHHTLLFNPDTQLPDERAIAYWVAKAKGGAGLLIFETLGTHRSAWWNPFRSPDASAVFKKTADTLHQYEVKIIAQLFHTGGQDIPRVIGRATWAPSPLPSPRNWAVPHEMTVDEIKELIQSFAYAATVMRETGWDGVELHGAHGYLIEQFMSPLFNRRTDDYGGSLKNHMRFPLEMISALRQAVGQDFTLGMRISGDEFVEGGYTLDDMLIMAPMLTQSGRLDYLNISAGNYRIPAFASETTYSPLNSIVYLAAAIKEVVSVPVLTKGRIVDPIQAEEIIANNRADMVAMCRALIADPEFPNKARAGKLQEIIPCISCNDGCYARVLNGFSISCVMNPVAGREHQAGWLELHPAATRKRVMVIGGGPAGLEAARVAALRGHSVSLYEKGSELGGQTLIAAKAPGRESFLDIARYYAHQMDLLGVNVNLQAEVNVDMVKDKNPDAVVVATGSIPFIPDIPGVHQDNVVEAREVLEGKAKVGQKVVVLAGEQHIQALSTADLLATQGKQVEVLCAEFHAGSQIEFGTKAAIYERLYRGGVTLTPCTALKEISGNSVVAVNVLTGQERRIEGVDTVVLACGGREDATLLQSLKGQVKELYAVGDCAGVRRLPDATMDGARVGRRI
jgi:mycofactocin system FadH/OYE family oxidoreductase 2